MPENILQIRLFVSSPSDVADERKRVETVVDDLNDTLGRTLHARIQVVSWVLDATPGLGRPQAVINKEIGRYDIFLGLMKARFGTPTGKSASGTEEEFDRALAQWKKNRSLRVLFYFSGQPLALRTLKETRQYEKVLAFRSRLSGLGLMGEYKSVNELGTLLKRHLANCMQDVVDNYRKLKEGAGATGGAGSPTARPSGRRPTAGATRRTAEGPIRTLREYECDQMKLAALPEMFSSFSPEDDRTPFMRLEISTTPGRVRGVLHKEPVYLMRDPIRPFSTQIGGTRSERKIGNPEVIPELMHLDLDTLKEMYPFICGPRFKWIRMVIAELSTGADVLDHLHQYDPDQDVRKIAAKNPSASPALMSQECLFCDAQFASDREIHQPWAESKDSFIIANDFPYGPHFHYIVIPKGQMHSWEDATFEHLLDMNLLMAKFLRGLRKEGDGEAASLLKGAPGVHIGFNSTIRHLVMTRHSRASAGASIAHVHKQVWGMARSAVNLADHVIRLCQAHEAKGRDYMGLYLEALARTGFVVWADERVALCVPVVQMAVHELQLIVNRQGASNYLDLTDGEIESLSKAEYVAIQTLKSLGISSFNEVMLTDELKGRSATFRLVVAFVTREVDIAVSELNHLYVVDKHPMDTIQAIMDHAREIERVTGEKLHRRLGVFLT